MRLVFTGPPVSKERHRDRKTLKRCPGCGMFLPRPKKSKYNPTEKAEEADGWEAITQRPASAEWPLKENVSVRMIFHPDGTELLIEPSDLERPEEIEADLTNIAKHYEDSLNKIVWKDDKQVVELHLEFNNESLLEAGERKI